MDDYVKYKRKNGSVYTWSSKLYTPVTLKTKNEFDRIARRYRMSQAELGAVIVMHYLENRVLSVVAVRQYKNVVREARKERSRKISEGKRSSSKDGGGFNVRLGDANLDAWFFDLDE